MVPVPFVAVAAVPFRSFQGIGSALIRFVPSISTLPPMALLTIILTVFLSSSEALPVHEWTELITALIVAIVAAIVRSIELTRMKREQRERDKEQQ